MPVVYPCDKCQMPMCQMPMCQISARAGTLRFRALYTALHYTNLTALRISICGARAFFQDFDRAWWVT